MQIRQAIQIAKGPDSGVEDSQSREFRTGKIKLLVVDFCIVLCYYTDEIQRFSEAIRENWR
jgi:hypothetical protein